MEMLTCVYRRTLHDFHQFRTVGEKPTSYHAVLDCVRAWSFELQQLNHEADISNALMLSREMVLADARERPSAEVVARNLTRFSTLSGKCCFNSTTTLVPRGMMDEPIESSVRSPLPARLLRSVSRCVIHQFTRYHLVALSMLVGILAIGLMFLPSHMYNNPSRFPKSDSIDEITPEQQLKAPEVLSGSQRDIILNSYSIFEPVLIIVLYGCSFHREIVGDELYTALVTAWTIGSVLAWVN